MPCERNNLSRDNLLNSSDNLTTNEQDENDSDNAARKIDASLSQQQQQHLSRDTITFETEKKHQQHSISPSSKTPLLYAKKNVQSYQEQPQPINEQFQQKSILLSSSSASSSSVTKTDFDGFYNIPSDLGKLDDFECKNVSSESNSALTSSINPFFNSTSEEFNSVKEVLKGNWHIKKLIF